MPNEDTSQAPSPAAEPTIPPQEASPAPAEPEAVQSGPIGLESAPVDGPVVEAQTAQTHGFEPIGSVSASVDEPLVAGPEETPSQHASPFAQGSGGTQKESPRIGDTASSTGTPMQTEPASHSARERSIKGNARKQERRRGKIEKLMTEIEKRGKISNDEVEKLQVDGFVIDTCRRHVSDATATRYLSELEKDGKIKQVGKTGTGVVYTKI